jgi:hypothetical protein
MTDSCGGSRRTELRGGIGMVEKTKMVQGEGSGPKVYQSILDGWLPRNCQVGGAGKHLRLRPSLWSSNENISRKFES